MKGSAAGPGANKIATLGLISSIISCYSRSHLESRRLEIFDEIFVSGRHKSISGSLIAESSASEICLDSKGSACSEPYNH